MRRETKVWLAEYGPLAAIPQAQRTNAQRERLRLLAQRIGGRAPSPNPELAEQLRGLWAWTGINREAP